MDSDSDKLMESSWVEVNVGQSYHDALMHASLEDSVLARLLKDAQDGSTRGSRGTSGATSQASPPSPPPSREELGGQGETTNLNRSSLIPGGSCSDWGQMDLASRPEISGGQPIAPPPALPQGYSIRHSPIMKGEGWIIDNLPFLLVTHACAVVLGGITVFIIMKRYSKTVTTN